MCIMSLQTLLISNTLCFYFFFFVCSVDERIRCVLWSLEGVLRVPRDSARGSGHSDKCTPLGDEAWNVIRNTLTRFPRDSQPSTNGFADCVGTETCIYNLLSIKACDMEQKLYGHIARKRFLLLVVLD
jgi:hypothetical protein